MCPPEECWRRTEITRYKTHQSNQFLIWWWPVFQVPNPDIEPLLPGPISPVTISGQVVVTIIPPRIVKEIGSGAETVAVDHPSRGLRCRHIHKCSLQLRVSEDCVAFWCTSLPSSGWAFGLWRRPPLSLLGAAPRRREWPQTQCRFDRWPPARRPDGQRHVCIFSSSTGSDEHFQLVIDTPYPGCPTWSETLYQP